MRHSRDGRGSLLSTSKLEPVAEAARRAISSSLELPFGKRLLHPDRGVANSVADDCGAPENVSTPKARRARPQGPEGCGAAAPSLRFRHASVLALGPTTPLRDW